MKSTDHVIRLSPRALASQRNGRYGGLRTAQKYGELFCITRAEAAGTATCTKYGREYFKAIGKKGQAALRKKRERAKRLQNNG